MERLTIACACGCGKTFLNFDGGGRPRRFVSGHNTNRQVAQAMRARLAARPDASIILSRAAKKSWEDTDYRQRMAESVQRQWADPKFKEKTLSAARSGIKQKWQDPEFRKRMVESGRVMAHNLQRPEVRAINRRNRSARMKVLWRTPEWIAKIKATHANQCGTTRISKPEKRLHAFLSAIGQPFELNKRFVLRRGYTMPDAFLAGLNLAVFTDGQYWHGKPAKKIRDLEQRTALVGMGIAVFVIDQAQPEEPQFKLLHETIGALRPS